MCQQGTFSQSLIPVCIFSPSFSLPSVLPSSSTLCTQDEFLAVEPSSSGCHSSKAPDACCVTAFSQRLYWFTVYLHSVDGYICFFQETQDFKLNTHTHLQMLQRKLYLVFICIFGLLVSLKFLYEMYEKCMFLKKSSGAAVVKYRFSEIWVIFRSLSKKR